ncbi:MAG: class I SAM-dependent methyltransferase [Actinobacteria bacterium]|nr:class I SAM-dependent methyltransferase [Actinomycetota bacterium]
MSEQRAANSDERMAAWLAALDERHLADLTPSEAARALRALSSCYVERRAKVGSALDTAGKRAAFALFYAPLHYLVVREIVRAIPGAANAITQIHDLGCGTGAAGAAWAVECGGPRVSGIDRHPWAVTEANWTYRQLGLDGRAVQGDVDRVTLGGAPGHAILAAYTINELPDATRSALLPRLLEAHARGARVLIAEPIARRMATWWDAWADAFAAAGGSAAEWRFKTPLPKRQHDLGRAAGLDPRELTARTLRL